MACKEGEKTYEEEIALWQFGGGDGKARGQLKELREKMVRISPGGDLFVAATDSGSAKLTAMATALTNAATACNAKEVGRYAHDFIENLDAVRLSDKETANVRDYLGEVSAIAEALFAAELEEYNDYTIEEAKAKDLKNSEKEANVMPYIIGVFVVVLIGIFGWFAFKSHKAV